MEHNYFIHVHSQGEDIPIRAQCLYILLREAISTISAAILEANSHYQENFKSWTEKFISGRSSTNYWKCLFIATVQETSIDTQWDSITSTQVCSAI